MIGVLVGLIAALVVFFLVKVALVALGVGSIGIAIAALCALAVFLVFLTNRDRVRL